MKWIKWWKDKTFLTILAVALLTMVAAFLLAYFIEWGWVLSLMSVFIGAQMIRTIIIKRIEEGE